MNICYWKTYRRASIRKSMKKQGNGFIVGSVGTFGNGVRDSMNNWKQFIFFVILVIACYQFLYFLSDMFLLGYINKYSWNLNFIQGLWIFFQYFFPMFLLDEFSGKPIKKRKMQIIEVRLHELKPVSYWTGRLMANRNNKVPAVIPARAGIHRKFYEISV